MIFRGSSLWGALRGALWITMCPLGQNVATIGAPLTYKTERSGGTWGHHFHNLTWWGRLDPLLLHKMTFFIGQMGRRGLEHLKRSQNGGPVELFEKRAPSCPGALLRSNVSL